MNKPVALDDLKGIHKEKIDNLHRGLDTNLYPTPKYVKRWLIINLAVEALVSATIYYNYDNLLTVHRLLAPALLGASTASLAQSMNQYVKKKLNFNKIMKFMVWGVINGSFTVLWIEFLMSRTDNLFYRILIDQLVGAPSFQLIFNVLSTLWDTGEISHNTKALYIRSLKYSYCFWPFFSMVSFGFIPQPLLFPANCLANLIWSLILSKLG